MSRRRGSDKPVERLRTGWTSDADLEETLAQMFHRDTVPGDKLTGIPASEQGGSPASPDHSAPEAPVILTPAGPDKLSGGTPDNLTGPLYQTLEGLVVDAKCIRPFDSAQTGHTPSEHAVYVAMWRMLASAGSDAESREGLRPMRLIAEKVSLSVRNLRRVLHSLMDKLAVDVTEYEDKTKSIPRRYRVWSPRMVVERRRRAGYTCVYRNRNLITLARPQVSLAGEHRSS
jgi:hypothetical protein